MIQIATVLFTLAMALTLIPALLGAWGAKLNAARREDADDGFFGRSARRIQRRPVLAAAQPVRPARGPGTSGPRGRPGTT